MEHMRPPQKVTLKQDGIVIALAVMIFLPHLIWQIHNSWPTLEFIEQVRRYKIAGVRTESR
jgi:hypothetical protein